VDNPHVLLANYVSVNFNFYKECFNFRKSDFNFFKECFNFRKSDSNLFKECFNFRKCDLLFQQEHLNSATMKSNCFFVSARILLFKFFI
jgi:hypothetical protein